VRYLSPFRFFNDLRRDPLAFFSYAATLGDAVELRAGFLNAWLLTHPTHIKHVLQDHSRNYVGQSRVVRLFQLGGGNGLLSTEGDLWLRQRRLIQPALHRDLLARAAERITDETESMLDRCAGLAGRDQPLDMARAMALLTLRIAGRAFFGTDLSSEVETLADSMTALFEHFNHRLFRLFTIPELIPTSRNRRFGRTSCAIERVVNKITAPSQRSDGSNSCLLATLLNAGNAPDKEKLTQSQIRDAVATFLGAASETTAVALAWTWYLIATNPVAELKLIDELRTNLAARTPTFRDLPKLRYTTMVVLEALRIFPPAWMMLRTAVEADEIGGFRIPRGGTILVSPYLTQRRADIWDEPNRFDPERFASERSQNRPVFSFFPFGGGPRQCPGDDFAMVEMVLIVATFLQRYRIRLVPGQAIEPRIVFAMRPRNGVMVTLTNVARTGTRDGKPLATNSGIGPVLNSQTRNDDYR
jgi:cytochrome P450